MKLIPLFRKCFSIEVFPDGLQEVRRPDQQLQDLEVDPAVEVKVLERPPGPGRHLVLPHRPGAVDVHSGVAQGSGELG